MSWANDRLYGETTPCAGCGYTIPALDDLCKYCNDGFWHEGQKMTFTQWSRVSGVARKKLYERLRVHCWPEEQAFWNPRDGCRDCGGGAGINASHTRCESCRHKSKSDAGTDSLGVLDDAGYWDNDDVPVIRIGDLR
jgi:hypothetical protein